MSNRRDGRKERKERGKAGRTDGRREEGRREKKGMRGEIIG